MHIECTKVLIDFAEKYVCDTSELSAPSTSVATPLILSVLLIVLVIRSWPDIAHLYGIIRRRVTTTNTVVTRRQDEYQEVELLPSQGYQTTP